MPQLPNINIYTVDWQRLIRWLIPIRMRKERWLAWLGALTAPVVTLYNTFTAYRDERLYFLNHTSQVVYMEAVLNDVFDTINRGIYIVDGVEYNPIYIYRAAELKPVYIRRASENAPKWLRTEFETLAGSADFVVMVPSTVSYDPDRMKALIDLYRLPSKSYHKIEIY